MPELPGSNTDAQAAFGEPAGERPGRSASRLDYVLAVLLILAAIGGAIAFFVHGFGSLDDRVGELQRVPVPGQGVVQLASGSGSIYFETPDGENAPVPAMQVSVVSGSGEPLALHRSGADVRYSLAHYDGQSIFGFDVRDAGAYTVTVTTRLERLPTSPVLAIGKGVGSHIVGIVLGGLGIFFGGLLAAGALILITWRRRRQA